MKEFFFDIKQQQQSTLHVFMIDNRSPVYYKKLFKKKKHGNIKNERLLNFYFIKGSRRRYKQIKIFIQRMFIEMIVNSHISVIDHYNSYLLDDLT